MAITTQITPSLVAHVRNPFTYVFSSNNSTQENFRFVLDVFTGSTGGTRIFRDKQSPLPATNRVEFSPHRILQDYMYPVNVPTISASTSGASYELLNYTIQVSEEYGAGTTGTTIYPVDKTVSGYCLNSVLTYQELPSWDYTNYIIYSATTDRKFLTNAPTTKKIREGEFETISFLTQTIPPMALDVYFRVVKYRTSGGTPSVTDFNISNRFTTGTTIRINHFGVGTGNLNPIMLVDINFETDYKYDIFIFYEDINGDVRMSETRTFLLDTTCSRFPTKRFMFQNRLGARDYFTATLAEKRNLKVESTTARKVQSYNYAVGERGEFVVDMSAQDSIVVNTNWLNDEESTWLKELFTTKDCYELQEDGSALPIILENTSEEIKQTVLEKLIKYEIKYRYAFNYNV